MSIPETMLVKILSEEHVLDINIDFSTFLYREEARNMWRSQEDRWKSEHVIRKARVEDLFATIKIQVGIIFIILILV